MGWWTWTSRLRMRLRRRSTRWYFLERETVYKLYIWRKISKLKPQPFSWTWTWTSPKTWICICKRKKTTKWMWKKRRGTTWTSRLRIKSTRWWMRRTSISPRGKLYLTGNSKRHNLFSIFKRTLELMQLQVLGRGRNSRVETAPSKWPSKPFIRFFPIMIMMMKQPAWS